MQSIDEMNDVGLQTMTSGWVVEGVFLPSPIKGFWTGFWSGGFTPRRPNTLGFFRPQNAAPVSSVNDRFCLLQTSYLLWLSALGSISERIDMIFTIEAHARSNIDQQLHQSFFHRH